MKELVNPSGGPVGGSLPPQVTMGVMAKRETVLSVTDLMKKYGDHVIVDNFSRR